MRKEIKMTSKGVGIGLLRLLKLRSWEGGLHSSHALMSDE